VYSGCEEKGSLNDAYHLHPACLIGLAAVHCATINSCVVADLKVRRSSCSIIIEEVE